MAEAKDIALPTGIDGNQAFATGDLIQIDANPKTRRNVIARPPWR